MQDRSPGAERFEQGGRTLFCDCGIEPRRIEHLGVVPPLRLTMQRTGQNGHRFAARDRVASGENVVGQGHSVEHQDRRREAQGLTDHLAQVGELADVVEGRHVIVVVAEHRVHLCANAGEHGRVVDEVVDGVRHELRRRQLSGDQERHDLVADVAGVELSVEHDVEQVPGTAGGVVGDHLVERGVQRGESVAERRCLAVGHHFGQCIGERLGDGRQPVVFEGVEAGAEARERDGVHRELLQIGGDVDGPAAGAGVPAGDQLVVHIEHRVVVGPQPGVAESRQQHVVGLLPGGFSVEGGEEAVAGERAHSRERGGEILGEPALVAELLDQLQGADVQLACTGPLSVEDRSVEFGEDVDGQGVRSPGEVLGARQFHDRHVVEDRRFGGGELDRAAQLRRVWRLI